MAGPPKLTAQAIGHMGELAVEMELLARGWTVGNFNATTKNTAGFDLFAVKGPHDLKLRVKAKRRGVNSILRICCALGFFLLPVPPTEAAGPQKFCEAQVGESLDLLKLDPSDIREITYEAQRHPSRESDQFVRILAWVNLHSCKGYVVIDLSPQCTFRQVYGRDGCSVALCDQTSGRGC